MKKAFQSIKRVKTASLTSQLKELLGLLILIQVCQNFQQFDNAVITVSAINRKTKTPIGITSTQNNLVCAFVLKTKVHTLNANITLRLIIWLKLAFSVKVKKSRQKVILLLTKNKKILKASKHCRFAAGPTQNAIPVNKSSHNSWHYKSADKCLN